MIVPASVGGDLHGTLGTRDVEDPDVEVLAAFFIDAGVGDDRDARAVLVPGGVGFVGVGGVGEVAWNAAAVAHHPDVALAGLVVDGGEGNRVRLWSYVGVGA